MNSKIKTIITFFFTIVLLEFSSYLLLKHLDIDGEISINNNVGLNIRDYLIDPINGDAKPRIIPQFTVGFINNPYYKKSDINNYGWRGKAPLLKKEKNTYRIVCLGGSTTFSYGVKNYQSSYPFFLQEVLSNKYPSKKIEVINAGVNALDSYGELNSFLFKIKYLEPDALILKSAGNDSWNLTMLGYNDKYSPDNFLSHTLSWKIPKINPKIKFIHYSYFISFLNIYTNYYSVIEKSMANNGVFMQKLAEEHEWFDKDLDFAIDNMEYYSFYNNFKTLVKLAALDDIKIYAMPFALNKDALIKYSQNEKHNNRINKYLEINDINNDLMEGIIEDYSQTWIPLESDSILRDAWLGDHCHLNENGNKFKAEFVSRFIQL